jgi:hypothetical protein
MLSSCGSLGDRLSALNPLNLLGGSEPVEAAAEDQGTPIVRPDDGQSDIPRIVNARLEYTPSGVIVRANGEAPSLGYHSARLRPLNFGQPDGNGAIWYEFRATAPASAQTGGTPYLRSLSVATFIPNSRLRAVQSVTVTGTENDVTIRLR